ncbi:MAG: ABC transporter permease [Treponema sp.]|nr:ABC transporter permease [Treponema sp.]
MTALVILIVESLSVIFLPLVLDLDPYSSDLTAFSVAPNAAYPLGTDSIGRDIFARLIYGGRVSLLVGFLAALTAAAVGVPLGLLAGYYRSRIETSVMRLVDIFMSFPSMILILVLVSVIGPSLLSVPLVIGFLGWTEFARITHSTVLSVREKEYVEAAKAAGTGDLVIMVKDILPNVSSPILVACASMTAGAILTESALSFLGMGVQPPMASWGNMLHEAQSITVLAYRFWQWLPPGLALVLTVSSVNFLGDGIRDALDPRHKSRRVL